MTVIMKTSTPLSRGQLEELSAKMNIAGNPPDGLIIHTAYESDGGGTNVIDVWSRRSSSRHSPTAPLARTWRLSSRSTGCGWTARRNSRSSRSLM